MRSDGMLRREYDIDLPTCVLHVREKLTPTNTHHCVIDMRVDGELVLVVRVVVRGDGSLAFGPKEEFRRRGFYGDWLPIEFDYDDFVALIRLRT